MTELLYLPTVDDAYRRTFTATITALPPGGAVLDRTLFYPTGGGQPCDLGRLSLGDGSEWSVADVTKSGPAVVHRLARRGPTRSALSVGAEVAGAVDWDRRYGLMRAHTFQHLLSARLYSLSGRRTRRAALSGAGGYVDLEGALPASLSLDSVHADLRDYRDRALPVRVALVSRAEYESDPGERSGLVALPAHVDPVRLVEIDASDRCPCGGTHVRSTSELGEFQLKAPIPLAGKDVRLAFTLSAAAPPTPPS